MILNFTVAACSVFCFSLAAMEDPAVELSTTEKRLLELTNAERAKKELPALKPAPLLFKVARAHAKNMAKQGKMEHELDGKSPTDRLRDADYKFAGFGENIAVYDGSTPLEVVMKRWMGSKIHHDNIMDAEFTEI